MIEFDLGEGVRLRSLGAAAAPSMHALLEADRDRAWENFVGGTRFP